MFCDLREAPGQMREGRFGVVPQPHGLAGSVEMLALEVDAADPVVVLRNPALVPLHELCPAGELLGVSRESERQHRDVTRSPHARAKKKKLFTCGR